jgi:hypothetical protein
MIRAYGSQGWGDGQLDGLKSIPTIWVEPMALQGSMCAAEMAWLELSSIGTPNFVAPDFNPGDIDK